MPAEIRAYPVRLPRHAASPRGFGRAGEIWRLCQEVAVLDSIALGWSPDRYVAEGVAFIVVGMAVRHHRELAYGEDLEAQTFVRAFHRGVLTTRELRLVGPQGLVAEATQRWVHVRADLKPARASRALIDAFPVYDPPEQPSVSLPAKAEARSGQAHRFRFEVWHTWMDPLAHVNHPVYVDWCDEGACRALAAAGLDPQRLAPVAEEVSWKRGAVAGERLMVRSQLVGLSAEGDAVLEHAVTAEQDEDVVYASATTVRRLAGEGGRALAQAII